MKEVLELYLEEIPADERNDIPRFFSTQQIASCGMSKLPVVNAKEPEKLLLQSGFNIRRQKGSHKFYKHPDGSNKNNP